MKDHRRPISLILKNRERHYGLEQLGRMLPDEPVHKTVWGWCTRGRRGVLMESIQGTHGLRSSIEAYGRFLEAING